MLLRVFRVSLSSFWLRRFSAGASLICFVLLLSPSFVASARARSRWRVIWPAFWMLGSNIDRDHWPACGEIDIMENVGHELSTLHGTLHGPGYSGGKGFSSSVTLPRSGRLSDGYHIYGVEWEPGSIRFLLDAQQYATVTPASLPGGARWVFDHPFFFILNLAVGGDWPRDPGNSTACPQEMSV